MAKGPERKKKEAVSKSKRAGITFPVGRILKYLRRGNYADRIGPGAGFYMASVLEYLVAEVLELAGNAAKDRKRQSINPRAIQLAIRNDKEFNEILKNVMISEGGVLPNIQSVLLLRSERENKEAREKKKTQKDLQSQGY